MGKVIIFNGPRMSGKDEFGNRLKQHFYRKKGKVSINLHHRMMKSSLNELVTTIYGVSLTDWWLRVDDRSLKEEPWDKLDGLSTREAQISVSERVMKPALGDDIFGKMLARTLDIDKFYYLTDGGFQAELRPVVEKFGTDNILVIRLHREGFTFEGDSRSYIENEWFPDVKMIDVKSGQVESTSEEIIKEVEKWLKAET